MKKIIVFLILVSFLFAPVFVSAQSDPGRNELLIQILNQLIAQMEQEISALSYQYTASASDDTLSSLNVNGLPISNFSANTTSYIYLLPANVAMPIITATPNVVNATVVISQTRKIPGLATITVTSQDRTANQIYTINFNLSR